MTLKAYKSVFTEPPSNSNNYIGVSNNEHPAILSLFKPSSTTITSIFVLVQNTTLAVDSPKSNALKLSIIELDSVNSYQPAYHEDAKAEASLNQNSFDTYVTELHDNSLSGVITKTNINYSGTQTWIEFKFTGGFITNLNKILDTNQYYGILISDTSESHISNKIFYADKSYNSSSLNRTLYLTIDDDTLTWQNYNVGNNNVQICVSYPLGEITTTESLNYGTISTGGPNSQRGTGLGIFVRNTSSSSTYKINNFVPVPQNNTVYAGLENFTYNSNYRWSYFNANTLPNTQSKIDAASIAASNLNIELDPYDFVFFYQKDWVAPIPLRYMSKSARQLLYVDNTGTGNPYDEIYDADASATYSTILNPAKPFKFNKVKLFSENDTQTISDASTPISKVFSTNYPNYSISSINLQEIRVNQILRDPDSDDLTYNQFEIEPYNTDYFVNSVTGLNLPSDFFEDQDYYLNSSIERSDWKTNNSLTSYEKGSTGILSSYGIEIDPDNSTNEKIILNNTRLFPSTVDGAVVTDVRAVNTSYNSDDVKNAKFKLSRNNTINLEGLDSYEFSENELKYRLVYHHAHADDNFQWPPHLIIRNYSAGATESQNLVCGGVALYTSSYSTYQGDLKLTTSDVFSGTISPSRTSIIDSNLGSYELPVDKTSYGSATSVYGKGLTVTIHKDSGLDADTATNGFVDDKYLVRHIIDNIVTIEGKVLSYGTCTVSYDLATKTITTRINNVSVENFADWNRNNRLVSGSNFRLALNPFGLLFSQFVPGQESVADIYNNGDPIELVEIDTFDATAGIITSTNVDNSFWRKIFPRNVSGTTYYAPHSKVEIPFYIIETPRTTSVPTSINSPSFGYAASITGSPYGAFDPKWIGQFPDFFQVGDQIYASGPYIAGTPDTNPNDNFIHTLGVHSNDALLPFPDEDGSIGFSITFPYIKHMDSLSDIGWLSTFFSGLGTTLSNIDLTEDDEVDIYDNPSEKFRSLRISGTTYHQYHIVDPLVPSNNSENIYKTLKYTDFENIGDSAHIHVSEYNSANFPNKFKHLSFTYSVSADESSGVSSTCELSLEGHEDSFILTNENQVIELIPSIVLNTTGSSNDAQISSTMESIYSYDFDNPLLINDFILKRTGGNSTAHINNFVLFDDMAVYGKCVNPVNVWRNTQSDMCEIIPGGYVVVDFGEPKRIHDIQFTISKSSTRYDEFEDGEVTFSILGLDPNVSNNFYEITREKNVNASTYESSVESFIDADIYRTTRYLLLQPTNAKKSVFAQNLRIHLEDFDVYYYSGTTPYTERKLVPSTNLSSNIVTDGVIQSPISQPSGYNYASYQYDDEIRYVKINPETDIDNPFNALYIPVGVSNSNLNLFYNSTTLSNLITIPTSITQISFNIKEENSFNSASNNSYLFKLYSTTNSNPGPDPGDAESLMLNGGGYTRFTERQSIFALPYTREPEEGFYTISSIDENVIYFDTSDIIFSNNNLTGYMARLDIFRDIYATIRGSGISTNGQSYIKIEGSAAGLGLVSGGQAYLERTNVISFPAFNATWLLLEYLNTTVPVKLFGLKVYTSVLDGDGNPVDLTSSTFDSMSWDIKINYVEN